MIRYVKYKGKELPVRLSYKVFKGLRTDVKVTETTNFDDLDPVLMETMLWYGLKAGHTAEEKPLELTREQMEDVLDECFLEFLNIIPEFFPKTQLGNVLKNLQQKQKELITNEEEPDSTT